MIRIVALAAVLHAVWQAPQVLGSLQVSADCRRVIQLGDAAKSENCRSKRLASEGRAWQETSTHISSRSVDLTSHASDHDLILPWSYAGAATVAGLRSDREERIEWFAAGGAFRRTARPREEVRLPEGSAIALARHGKDIIAVSRPMTIRRGMAQEAQWVRSSGNLGQVLALLARPRDEDSRHDSPALTLVSESVHHAPDVFFETEELLLGIWYRTNAGETTLDVRSSVVHLPQNRMELRRGTLNALEAELRPLPNLVVSAGPAAHGEWPASKVVIHDAVTEAAVREILVRLGEPVVVEHLPPRQVQVVLSVGDAWRFARAVDLREVQQANVDFALSPFRVTGTLLEGDRAVKGSVSFRSDGRRLTVDTDDRGQFELEAWSPGRYLYEARAASFSGGASSYSSHVVLSASSPELTIRLPTERLRVRVADGESDAPLTDAAVMLRNTWLDPTEGQRRFASRFRVDERGEVSLPPIHAGEAEVLVEAPGYVHAQHKLTIAAGTDRLLRVALRRDETSILRVTLADGAPAAGAEAVALANGTGVGWHGVADRTGRLQVSNRLRGAFLVIRHSDAASRAVLFDDVALARGTVRLERPAAVLHVRPEGAGVANPTVLIWLDGVRLDGPTTAFAVWTPLPFVDHSGVWRARNLPAGDLRVLVTSPGNLERARTGTLDGLFATIGSPWSGVVPVRIAE